MSSENFGRINGLKIKPSEHYFKYNIHFFIFCLALFSGMNPFIELVAF